MLPASHARGAVDFIYPGKGPATDAFVPNKMWGLLHQDEFSTGALAPELVGPVVDFRNAIRSRCNQNQVPCFQRDGGVLYFTFAGYLVNKAIGLSTGRDFKAEELTIWASSPIQWGNVGSAPEAYEAYFPNLFEVSSDLSIYQSMLPADLQLAEFLQMWLKDETIRVALQRLRNSTSITVAPSLFAGGIV